MAIFDLDARPGTKTHGLVKVGELAFGSPITLPVMVLSGEGKGPLLWVCGNVHGDELNGPLAMMELYRELDPARIRGSLVLTPLLNAPAFMDRAKMASLDRLDMDTVFPGDPQGLQAERTAQVLFREITRHADAVINLHSHNTRFEAIPYANYKIVPGADPAVTRRSQDLAAAFGTRVICRIDLATADGELPGVTRGALDICCISRGIPAFMAELGAGGRAEPHNIALAKQGLVNVMSLMGMCQGDRLVQARQVVIQRRRFLRANRGGYLQVLARLGEIHPRGVPYARLFNWWEDLDLPCLEREAYVIATRVNPLVATGEKMIMLGTEWTEESARPEAWPQAASPA